MTEEADTEAQRLAVLVAEGGPLVAPKTYRHEPEPAQPAERKDDGEAVQTPAQ